MNKYMCVRVHARTHLACRGLQSVPFPSISTYCFEARSLPEPGTHISAMLEASKHQQSPVCVLRDGITGICGEADVLPGGQNLNSSIDGCKASTS